MSDSRTFSQRALEYLDSLSDAEFLQQLEERCPELLHDPGEPPADAMIPDRTMEDTLTRATHRLEELAEAAHRSTEALGRLAKLGAPQAKPARSAPKTKKAPRKR